MLGILATAGTSALDAVTKAAISSGLADMSATVNDVILITIPVSIGVIALTAGVRYALRKVKGVLSQAS